MLPVPQPGKKLPSLYRTQRVIALFRRARNLPLPWITSVQSTPPAFYFLKSTLILFYYIRLGVSPKHPVYICLLPHLCDRSKCPRKDKILEEEFLNSSRNVGKQLSSDDASYRRTDTPWTIKWTEHAIRMDKIKNSYKFIFGRPTWRSPPEILDIVG